MKEITITSKGEFYNVDGKKFYTLGEAVRSIDDKLDIGGTLRVIFNRSTMRGYVKNGKPDSFYAQIMGGY